jgi:hypothetical protein
MEMGQLKTDLEFQQYEVSQNRDILAESLEDLYTAKTSTNKAYWEAVDSKNTLAATVKKITG